MIDFYCPKCFSSCCIYLIDEVSEVSIDCPRCKIKMEEAIIPKKDV